MNDLSSGSLRIGLTPSFSCYFIGQVIEEFHRRFPAIILHILEMPQTSLEVALAPNLRRDRVSFAGTLRHPLRFREAMSALHDVVISDLRSKPKDRTAWHAYQAEQKKRAEDLRRRINEARQMVEQARAAGPPQGAPQSQPR